MKYLDRFSVASARTRVNTNGASANGVPVATSWIWTRPLVNVANSISPRTPTTFSAAAKMSE